MRRFFAFLMAATMMVGVAACSDEKEGKEENPDTPPVELSNHIRIGNQVMDLASDMLIVFEEMEASLMRATPFSELAPSLPNYTRFGCAIFSEDGVFDEETGGLRADMGENVLSVQIQLYCNTPQDGKVNSGVYATTNDTTGDFVDGPLYVVYDVAALLSENIYPGLTQSLPIGELKVSKEASGAHIFEMSGSFNDLTWELYFKGEPFYFPMNSFE